MNLLAFTSFTAEHFVPVLIGIFFTVVVIKLGLRNERWKLITTGILAVLNLGAYAYSQAAWLSLGEPVDLDNALPLVSSCKNINLLLNKSHAIGETDRFGYYSYYA